MQTDFSIYMGMLLTYLPLMILPLYAVMIRLDDDLIDAAADLGASRVEVFRTIVLPLTVPGIIAGSLLVFIPAVGAFVIPALLGLVLRVNSSRHEGQGQQTTKYL